MTTAAKKQKVVWTGAKALRRFLVPIEDVEPFPGNSRRGNIPAIRESLRRFGQTKSILGATFPGGTGKRIAAGHHFLKAADLEGFTHVAVIPNEFASEEEARAYLLADNRTHDLGYYDLDELNDQLRLVQETVGLEGTGYTKEYLDEIDAQMKELQRQMMAPEEFPAIDPATLPVDHTCPSCGYSWSGSPNPNGEPPEEG